MIHLGCYLAKQVVDLLKVTHVLEVFMRKWSISLACIPFGMGIALSPASLSTSSLDENFNLENLKGKKSGRIISSKGDMMAAVFKGYIDE